MTDRTLHDLTADELIELLADLERVQVQAEELLLTRMRARRPGHPRVAEISNWPSIRSPLPGT